MTTSVAIQEMSRALRDVPTIWRKAVEHAEKHNATILQAQAQLPALEKAFDEAKTAYTRAGFKPQVQRKSSSRLDATDHFRAAHFAATR